MKLIIREAPEPGLDGLVAVIDDYAGPVPRVGEYIIHPPLDDYGGGNDPTDGHPNVMSVKTVTYGILQRPARGKRYFAGRNTPVVEVWV